MHSPGASATVGARLRTSSHRQHPATKVMRITYDPKNYGERRIICFGYLRDRLVVVVYTPRGADRHVFSMRNANEREKARITAAREV